MKKIACIFGLLLIFLNSAYAGDSQDTFIYLTQINKINLLTSRNLPGAPQDSQYQSIFEDVWETVNKNFYDPNFAGVDWKAVRERYRPQVAAVKDDAAFLALMKKMLKELPVSHLAITPPTAGQKTSISVTTRTIDDQQVVVSIFPLSDARQLGLRPGDAILTPPENWLGEVGEVAQINIKGCDGQERAVQLRRGRYLPAKSPSSNVNWFIYEKQPGIRVGYLRVSQFDGDDIAAQIDAAMSDLNDTQQLIIDVRDNPGGNTSFIRLVSYFIPGQSAITALMMRSALERMGGAPAQIDLATLPKVTKPYTTAEVYKALLSNKGAITVYSEDLGNKVYKGKVAVLINQFTGSAAEGFAGVMKAKTKATLIGQTTAGQLLSAQWMKVKGDWRLFIPTAAAYGPDGKPAIDTPTTPNIEAKPTRQDICGNRDPVLMRALTVLNQTQ
jgi:carboxyl-terminal processing protease